MTLPALPEPAPLERWVGAGGWLVEVLLPRTDAGLVQPWWGGAAFTAGLFAVRASH